MSAPNILLIITDQQAATALSCAGNSELHTPAMDRIAERGVRFGRAYCTQPLCVPSRASFATGRYPHEVGVPYNLEPENCPQAQNHPWLGKVMAEAGYETAWVGKWHLPALPDDAHVHGFEATPLKARSNKLDWLVAPHCDRLLQQKRDKPLFLVASFVNPHDCCQVARDQELPNGPIDAPPPGDQCPPLPANFDPPAGEPTVLRDKVQPGLSGVYPTADWDENRWRQYRWQYNRLVEKVDAHIGEVLDSLDRAGLADDTVIVFTSDHGDGIGGHRWNQKQVLYEEAARVPLIVAGPAGSNARRGETDERLVSMNIDLMPTLCDYADCAVPANLPGRSLRPVVEGGEIADWHEAVYCETEFSGFGLGSSIGVKGRMVRTDRYKYIVYSEGERREQFFDLTHDPGEMCDLSDAAEAAGELDRHRALLRDWCAATGDDFAVVGGG